jgi:gluconate 2-dehydrogenase gamma chain
MSGSTPTRREFVSTSAGMLGGSWLWLNLPVIASLSSCARDAAERGDPFNTFTNAEGAAMRAFAARVIPSAEGSPGAEEAGAVWFADRALAELFPDMLPPLREGLAGLDERARKLGGASFAGLDAEQQDALIGDVVDTPFFFLGRMLVVMGVFSDPTWGGNRDHVGETLLAITHAASYQPPFGWYDAEHVRVNGGAA